MAKTAYSPGDARQAAFQEIEPHRPFLQAMIMACIGAAGEKGLTCDEVEWQTLLPHQTASARVNELAKTGAIVPNGKRKTRSGRFAVVWVRDSKR
jgi:hypothetical protein